MFCENKRREVLVVQTWEAHSSNGRGWWVSEVDFELSDYEKACQCAMNITLERKPPIQLAVFEDGKNCENSSVSVDSATHDPEHP